MIKAGIFDLDGTLAYTLDSMAYIANEVMQQLFVTLEMKYEFTLRN